MKIAVFGATRGIGRCLAERFAERGDELFVLGRDPADAEATAGTLAGLGARSTGSALCDLADPDGFAAALRSGREALDGLDMVVLTAAVFAVQPELDEDPERALDLLRNNFAHSIAFCEAARKELLEGGGGTLCVFSSVAGDKPRKPVVTYGATKAGLSYYLDALDLVWSERGLRVVTVKPGFVRTDMTAGLEPPPFSADPEDVARVVLRGLDRGKRVIYAPPIWRWVMLALRMMPRTIFRRLTI